MQVSWHVFRCESYIFYFYVGLTLAICFISVGALVLFVSLQVSINHTSFMIVSFHLLPLVCLWFCSVELTLICAFMSDCALCASVVA